MAICIDSDIFIDFLRGHQPAKKFLSKMLAGDEPVYFSAITEAELLSGKSCVQTTVRELVIALLSNFIKIPVDNPVAQLAGYLRRTHHLSLPDALIAATAMKMEAELYTRNKKDFAHLPDLVSENPY